VKVLTDDSWTLAAAGPVYLALISGSGFWVHHGPSAPSASSDYIPVMKDGEAPTFHSYGGSENSYVRRSNVDSGSTVRVSVTPIV
jgi:hypothetical protein